MLASLAFLWLEASDLHRSSLFVTSYMLSLSPKSQLIIVNHNIIEIWERDHWIIFLFVANIPNLCPMIFSSFKRKKNGMFHNILQVIWAFFIVIEFSTLFLYFQNRPQYPCQWWSPHNLPALWKRITILHSASLMWEWSPELHLALSPPYHLFTFLKSSLKLVIKISS